MWTPVCRLVRRRDWTRNCGILCRRVCGLVCRLICRCVWRPACRRVCKHVCRNCAHVHAIAVLLRAFACSGTRLRFTGTCRFPGSRALCRVLLRISAMCSMRQMSSCDAPDMAKHHIGCRDSCFPFQVRVACSLSQAVWLVRACVRACGRSGGRVGGRACRRTDRWAVVIACVSGEHVLCE